MDQRIVCGGFDFFSNFDSANLASVEQVPNAESAVAALNCVAKGVVPEIPDVEFNVWTKPDCGGTEFENSNRTWFYFGMRACAPGLLVKLNLVNLNKQAKMYSQGMAPVFRVLPGKPHWERIRDRPTYSNEEVFTVSFKFKTPENIQSITYFAFTYPYSYTDLQNNLNVTDSRFLAHHPLSKDDIYYVRECLCYSLDGRRVELITVSSYHNISVERETRLVNLFPEISKARPYKFVGKKVVFISARVHPGETPSSFVFNGFLNLLTTREDPIAIMLRKHYVFKLIPCLNPDGVSRGHYRTDTRGVNLNRVYLKPRVELHPSIYAARALLRYYHFGFEKEDEYSSSESEGLDSHSSSEGFGNDSKLSNDVSHMTLEERNKLKEKDLTCSKCNKKKKKDDKHSCNLTITEEGMEDGVVTPQGDSNCNESGLHIYVDMHGHASKKGIFMYGNHFEELERNVECMLLPKLMSLNNHNFHFTACNFTERNMYLKDKRDGMSREGSGRVAVLKMTGLVRSYTLECNYNTGRLVNVLPPTVKETNMKGVHTLPMPPKYNPHVFEEVGRALGASILDLSGQNPLTRLPGSEFHSLSGLKEWLRIHCANEFGDGKMSAKLKLKNAVSFNNQGKNRGPVKRSISAKVPQKKPQKTIRSTSVPIDRKENVIVSSEFPQPSCSHVSSVGSAGSVIAEKSKPQPRQTKTITLRTRPRKEAALRIKNRQPTIERNLKSKGIQTPTSTVSRQKLKIELPNPQAAKPACGRGKDIGKEILEPDQRVQLREICFIKDSEGKKVIAKYKKTDSSPMLEDNLIVAWDASNTSAQVFSQKSLMPKFLIGEPGPSRQGAFRVHNFSKSNSFVKTKRNGKRNLRRLSTNESPGKVDKARKRKKPKPKP